MHLQPEIHLLLFKMEMQYYIFYNMHFFFYIAYKLIILLNFLIDARHYHMSYMTLLIPILYIWIDIARIHILYYNFIQVSHIVTNTLFK